MSRFRFVGWGLAALAAAWCGLPVRGADTLHEHPRWVTSVDVAGGLIASGGGQSLQYRPGDVKLWDAASGELVASLEGHEANVWSVALSPDAKTLVSTGYDGTITVWDLEQKKAAATLEKKGWCRSADFAPDGSHFATAHEDGTVTIWSRDGKEVRSIKAHESQVFQVAYSPDGAQLATASADKTVKLWKAEDGTEAGKLEGHEDAVWTVAYGKGGLLASGGADRHVILWQDGKERARMKHADWVSQVAFSPEGDVIAAADQGRQIKLWDVASGEQAASIGPLGGTQWSVAFTADGKQLISGGRKDALRVWDVRPRRIYEVTDHFKAAAEEKAAEKKAAEEKAAEEKAAEKKAAEEKAAEEKAAEEKAAEEKAAEEKAAEEKAAEKKAAEKKAAEEKAAEEKPAEEKAAEEKPAEKKAAEEKPVEEKPAEEKPAEEKPQ